MDRNGQWNGPFRSDRSNREKRSTSKGGPLFSKLFRLDLTDPFSFRPKFPEILVEWIAPYKLVRARLLLVINYHIFRGSQKEARLVARGSGSQARKIASPC